jgi:hypothetical protein
VTVTTWLELDITLRDVKPAPWRRIQMPVDATFYELHAAIQDACGWEDDHLFRFTDRDDRALAGLGEDIIEGTREPDPTITPVSRHFPRRRVCLYLYDFGDWWEHDVRLVRTFSREARSGRRLVDGELAFPPEDCGGVWGYGHCLLIARGGGDGEDDELRREWLGDWDPEAFDLEATKAFFDA